MLARLRTSAEDKDQGFTLIELLVVIIIIGILAAIAIPVFLNQRKKGWDAAVKSDLRNAATSEETFLTEAGVYTLVVDNGAVVAKPAVGLTDVGFKYSDKTNYSGGTALITVKATGGTSYCLTATSASTNVYYYNNASGGFTTVAC